MIFVFYWKKIILRNPKMKKILFKRIEKCYQIGNIALKCEKKKS